MRRAAIPVVLAFAGCRADDASSSADTEPASSDGSTSGTGDDVADTMTDAGPSETGTDGMTEGGMTEGDATSGPTDTGPTGCMGDEECTEPGAPFAWPGRASRARPRSTRMRRARRWAPARRCASRRSACSAPAENDDACMGTTPLCDADTNTCTACMGHGQCPDSACHIPSRIAGRETDDDGACFDPRTMLHVDGDGGRDHTAAVGAVAAGQEGVIVVHAWSGNYDQAVTVDAGKRLAILAAAGEEPNWIQGNNMAGPQLSLTGADTVVYLDRMRLAGNLDANDPALRVNAGRVHAQRSRLVQNSGGGIVVQNTGALDLENSFVGGNGQDFADTPRLAVAGSSIAVVYSTLAANRGNVPHSIVCSGPVMGSVRNSIVVGLNADSIDCGDVTFTNTLVDTGGLGGSNVVQNLNPAWFPNIAAADYHVAVVGPYDDLAIWEAGDPLVDIDGDARPNNECAADYAGADIP